MLLKAEAMAEGLVLFPKPAGTVQSVHRDYVNIQSGKDIIALVRTGMKHIPFGVEVNTPADWFELGVKHSQSVIFTADTIVINDGLAITGLDTCPRFSCRPLIFAEVNDLLLRLESLQQLCEADRDKGGIMVYLSGYEAQKLINRQHFTEISSVVRAVQELMTGVLKYDDALICRGVRGLLGMGPGSTPSWDDFLLGFLSAIKALRRNTYHQSIEAMIHSMLRYAPESTTFLSNAYLNHGVNENYHQCVTEMIDSFGTQSVQNLLDKAKTLVKLGHSSGADLLTGFVYGGFTALAVNCSQKKGASK